VPPERRIQPLAENTPPRPIEGRSKLNELRAEDVEAVAPGLLRTLAAASR